METIAELNAKANQMTGGAPGNGPNGRRLWNGNARIGTIYQLALDDIYRVGNCWAKGRLRAGDNVLCVGKSGDSFYDYVLLDTKDYSNQDGLQLTAISKNFGAYQFGMPVCHLSDGEYASILEGKTIKTDYKW